MTQPTQTMECTPEVPYISIYEKPKRPRGRPKTCTLTDGEKVCRKRQDAKRLYYENYEYRRLQQALYYDRVRLTKQK